MRARRLRFFMGAAFAAFSLATPGLSLANGRFPLADQLVVDPQDPSHLVLRTTYGILNSSDAGGSWGWVCEAGIGYGGTQDPAIGVLGDGTVLAGIFEGLSVTHDHGCSWAFAAAPLKGEYVIDVSVHRDEPTRAVAITSTGMGAGMGFHVILTETGDNGVTWTQAGTAINSDMISLTVDVAPSKPDRVYVSGSAGTMYVPAIETTNDRGMTWTRTFFDAVYAKEVPYIAGVDPTNPDRLYVRLSGADADHLLLSDDGAQTFTEIFSTASDLLGFALSPDGKRVVLGSVTEGILMANTSDHIFQKISSIQSRCLAWTNAGIYTCANEFTDKFTVGLSTDEGKTFTGIYNLPEICPLACPMGAQVTAACTSTWPALAATLGIDQTKCSSGSSGSSSSSSSGSSSSTAGGSGGCGCSVATSPRQTSAELLALGVVFAAYRRRRNRSAR